MSEPIVFISNQRVKEGKLGGYKDYYRQVAEQAQADKPSTIAHLAYLNEEGSELSIIHIFPVAHERRGRIGEKGIRICGNPWLRDLR
jgi:hypothetical protein